MSANLPETPSSQVRSSSQPVSAPNPSVGSGQDRAGGAAGELSAVRHFLLSRGNSALADRCFRALMVLCALSIFAVVALILWQLVAHSELSLRAFGLSFFYRTFANPVTHRAMYWDPVRSLFSALPFLYGTLVSSFLALVISVPLAIGVAVFLTEMCPRALRAPLAFLTELLAAIPSVIYGLWGVFVLVPILRAYVDPCLSRWLGWTGLFADINPTGLGFLAAGIILAVMILPIISSLAREVMSAVPNSQREAALALGATRWEMIRIGVLRNARAGIAGAIILGLGRALGETMAVTMIIGNTPEIHRSLLANGSSMAAVIANQFTEAISDMHLSALVEIGLALFLLTIVVNALAQLLVWAVTRGEPAQAR